MILTHEHNELYRQVKSFVEKELNPHVAEWEREGLWPAREVLKKMGKLGFLGISRPEVYGGLGLDYSYEMVFAQALGNCNCGGVPMGIGVQTNMGTPALSRFGSEELKREYLVPAIAGDVAVSIAVSEAGAGSDVHENKSLIVVPMDAKGIDRKTKLDKLGMRSSDTAMVFLDNVRVPQRNLIGQEGAGFVYQMLQFQEERLFVAMNGVDGMGNLIDETIEYTRQRHTFGKPIIENQYVHFRLAELKTEIEALKALLFQATEEYVAGRDVTLLASMAKLKAGRLSREVTDSCLQYWGGQGYMWESNVARAFRDTRLLSIGGGADEIMLGVICKLMGILPNKKRKSAEKAQEMPKVAVKC